MRFDPIFQKLSSRITPRRRTWLNKFLLFRTPFTRNGTAYNWMTDEMETGRFRLEIRLFPQGRRGLFATQWVCGS
jgi:hypothetical protein